MSGEHRPWKYPCEEPKSVLYSSDIQIGRSSISPVKMTSVSVLADFEKRRPRVSPVKQKRLLPNTSLVSTGLSDDICESSAEMRVISRAQNWNNSHSPAKVLVTLGDNSVSKSHSTQLSSKRVKKQLWTTTVYETRKEHKARDITEANINTTFGQESLEVKNTSSKTAANVQVETLNPQEQITSINYNPVADNVSVKKDAEGYAIPSMSTNSHNSPSRNFSLEPSSVVTPDRISSPREQFYTPMAEMKSNYKSVASHNYLQDPMKSSKLSINDKGSPVSWISSFSSFNTTSSIGEKTRAKMEQFDRVSEKMDSSFKYIREMLNQPIFSGRQPMEATPEFTDTRHTLPASGFIKKVQSDVVEPRLSLPNNVLNDAFEHTVGISSKKHMDGNGDKSSETKDDELEISLPKALGARMLAELNYSDKGDQMMYHLRKTEELGDRVTSTISNEKSMNYLNDTLNSISLRDSSLESLQLPITKGDSGRRFQPAMYSMLGSLRNASGKNAKEVHLSRIIPSDELATRKQLVRAHNRMIDRLFKLKHVVLKAKERLCTDSGKLIYLRELAWSFEAELRKRCADALSWIVKPISQDEFILFVKQHQRRIMMDTEEMITLMKSLMYRIQKKGISTIENSDTKRLSRAIRVDTKSLNESVDCDVWNASARTMRVGLNALRQEAEELNRSFEEKNKHLEQRTRESIAVQIQQYDKANKERKSLLDELDNIEKKVEDEDEFQPDPASTPRRLGVEPLDLSLLEIDVDVNDDVQVPSSEPMPRVSDLSEVPIGSSITEDIRSMSEAEMEIDRFEPIVSEDIKPMIGETAMDSVTEISQSKRVEVESPKQSIVKPDINLFFDDHPSSFNRSELTVDLSSSILHAIEEWKKPPRTRYALSSSLLDDSIQGEDKRDVSKPRNSLINPVFEESFIASPRERFVTRMPPSPKQKSRYHLELEESLLNVDCNDYVQSVAESESVELISAQLLESIYKQDSKLLITPRNSTIESTPVQTLLITETSATSDSKSELDETYEDLITMPKREWIPSINPEAVRQEAERLEVTTTGRENAKINDEGNPSDTPRPERKVQMSEINADQIREAKVAEISKKIESPDWISLKVDELAPSIWDIQQSRGFMRSYLEEIPEFIPAPVTFDDEDEAALVDAQILIIWGVITDLAADIWTRKKRILKISEIYAIPPATVEEFTTMSKEHTLMILCKYEEPLTHRLNRISWMRDKEGRSDPDVERIVQRKFFADGANFMVNEISVYYRKICDQICAEVGDYVVTENVYDLVQISNKSDVYHSSLNGELGRMSLEQDYLDSRPSITGRISSPSPLRVSK